MNIGRSVLAQIKQFIPWISFSRIVHCYDGNAGVRRLSCSNQFRVMAFVQLTWRESLRDIDETLGANASKLYSMGFRHSMHRSTLADTNESRACRIWADLAAVLIRLARKLYSNEEWGFQLKNTANALDATTIDLCLCLSLFDWTQFRKTKADVKLHELAPLKHNPVGIRKTKKQKYDHDVTMSSATPSLVEVVTRVQRRRRWTD